MTLTVAILGRPNVGKSTLFNRLAGRRLALVDDTPGVTRDRREAEAKLGDLRFRIIDTAGLEDAAPGELVERMQAQTARALADADVALFLVDARAGITPLDRHFAEWLRRSGKPVIVAANKAEGRAFAAAHEAFALGLGDPGRDLGRAWRGARRPLPRARPLRRPRGRSRAGARTVRGAAAAARDRRPAECRQIDPRQPPARRRAHAHRRRARHHPRRDRQ